MTCDICNDTGMVVEWYESEGAKLIRVDACPKCAAFAEAEWKTVRA
jgi:ribosomal protein S27AE